MSRFSIAVLAVAVLASIAMPVWAELQNVEVGGELRIRGRYYNFFATDDRWVQWVPGASMPGRSMGQFRGDGGIWSRFDWDDRGSDRKYVEQQSVIKVDAEFSDDVCAQGKRI